MKKTIFAAALALACALAACREDKPAPVTPVTAPAAAPAQVAAPPAAPAPAALPANAEVELSGTLDLSGAPAAKYLLYVSREACPPGPTSIQRYGTQQVLPGGPPNFFLEVFVPQKSTGSLCAVALDDKNRIVGVAAAPGNPMTFEGGGEVVFSKIALALKKIAPTAAPTGLVP